MLRIGIKKKDLVMSRFKYERSWKNAFDFYIEYGECPVTFVALRSSLYAIWNPSEYGDIRSLRGAIA